MMSKVRFLVFACVACAAAMACSDSKPRPLGDSDATTPFADAALEGDGAPCSLALEGCPCSNPGAQAFCGTVYRHSGDKTDCAKGYAECQADGGFGPCLGPAVFPGD